MSRAWSYSSPVLINCRGFHETNAKAASLSQPEKNFGGFFLFVWKEVPLFRTFPILFFQHPAYPGREEAPHSNQTLTVQQECLSVSAPISALSSLRTDNKNIKNIRTARSFHLMKASDLQGHFSNCFFQDMLFPSVISGNQWTDSTYLFTG